MMRNSAKYFSNPKIDHVKGEAVDSNKMKFLEEVTTLLKCAENCYRRSNHILLGNVSNILAFMGILMKEYILATRIYSVAA
jgi:hypothetical protein